MIITIMVNGILKEIEIDNIKYNKDKSYFTFNTTILFRKVSITLPIRTYDEIKEEMEGYVND
tara:strand:- start:442 stop:627 length:186 start_codon:yes stop_codon:yes gene_type:complete